MGGKDIIVVDKEVDFELVVKFIVVLVFGFLG